MSDLLPPNLPPTETIPVWVVTLIRNMSKMEDLSRVAIEEVKNLSNRMARVEQTSEENNRCLKGHNGDAGLCGQMEAMAVALEDIKAYQARLEIRLTGLTSVTTTTQSKTETVQAAPANPNIITWTYLIEKFGSPVITAIIVFTVTSICPAIAVLIYYLSKGKLP